MSLKRRSVLPGFGLTMGCTLSYLSLLVLIPLAALFLKSTSVTWADFWAAVSDPEAIDAYKLSFGASFVAAAINAFFGLIVAWTLVRYSFVGKKFIDAVVDLPFAMPTAVSGIALAQLYSSDGWVGRWLAPYGIEIAYSRWGVIGGADLHRPAVRRSHAAAGAGRHGHGGRGGGGQPGGHSLADAAAGHSPDDLPGAADRFCVGLRPGAGRIRLGDFHLQQVGKGDLPC